jgi:hypothetical protein
MVEKIGDLVDAHAALAEQIEYHAGIDGSGPCSHRQSVHRREAHRRRDTLAVSHGTHAAAVSQVRHHDPPARDVTHDAGQDARNIFVRESVEPVPLDSARGEVTRQRIVLRDGRLRAVECSIEAGDPGEMWCDSLDRADGSEIVGLVQGRQRPELLQLVEDRGIDEHRRRAHCRLRLKSKSDPSKWQRRTDESLRIVTDEQWEAAHARIKATAARLLRNRDGQFLAQVEAAKGRGQYLLSGFLISGAPKIPATIAGRTVHVVSQGDVCGEPLVATKRGRRATSVYVCRGWREGRDGCEGRAGVPMAEMDGAVISSLSRTFSTESFETHLRQVADDVEAREQRRAEREHLLVEIPKLAAAEARLAKAIARTDEADALVAELKATQQERRDAEARVAYLEGVEMDVKTDQDRVEQLREQWGTWSQCLDDDPLLARQVLRKVLASPIKVTPRAVDGAPSWRFIGVSRYDGVLAGGLTKGEVVRVPVDPALIRILDDSFEPLAAHPISGGSDAPITWEPTVCDPSGPAIFTTGASDAARPSSGRSARDHFHGSETSGTA